MQPLVLLSINNGIAKTYQARTYHPTFPVHVTVMVTFLPGGISVSSRSWSHEKTGRLMSAYSVSYTSYTDKSPSVRAARAGAIVESSNDNLRKSMGSFETFSNVSRRVDLPQVSCCMKQDCPLATLPLSVV